MVKKSPSRVTKQDIIDKLIENNALLQKKTTELLISMNNLTKKIDKVIEIFSKAAEHIERGEIREPLVKKLTELLEQNRSIARGLLLLEKYVREKTAFAPTLPRKEEEVEF